MWRCAEDQTAVLPAQMNERPAGQQHGRRAHDECTFMLFTHQSNRQCQEGGDTLMLNTLTNAWVSGGSACLCVCVWVCVCVCVCVCLHVRVCEGWGSGVVGLHVRVCVCVCVRVGEVEWWVCMLVCVCVCVFVCVYVSRHQNEEHGWRVGLTPFPG